MKTAVQTFFDELVSLGFIENPDDLLVQDRLKQALKTEKQQIIDAHKMGQHYEADWKDTVDSQQYYKQTYGSEG
jgi:hypothetical protein